MSFVKSTNVITDVALTVSGLTGGTNGKIVRMNGTNIVTDASSGDTAIQLNTVLFKIGDIYYSAGLIEGLTGLSAGSPYFLDSDGTITASPPTPSATVRTLFIGFALNTTDLIFRPSIPISGT